MIDARIIVTADDLGLDAGANQAVVRSLHEGLVSNASLLVNLPAFEEACQLTRQVGFANRIGLHFNLTQGVPLTDAMRRLSRFCVNGSFVPHYRFSGWRPLSSTTKAVLAAEIEAQIAAARAQGFPLTHFDAHNDVHAEPAIASVVATVARAAGITRIRPARNCGPGQGVLRWAQHQCFNAWLRRQRLQQVSYFGTVDDVLWLARQGPLDRCPSIEVMTHPRMGPDDTVLDAPFPQSLDARVRQLRDAFDFPIHGS